PTDDGESPISKMTDWVNTTCPCCGGPAKRETDTMPQWAGSSWYYLRYMDPHNDKAAVSREAEEYWGPVDWYNGGMEHTTLHLLYSRFWHKFLYDIGVVHTVEPYARRTSHGMILGKNPHYVGNVETEEEKQALIAKYGNQALRPAVKMSKSLGNVVNPDDVVKAYGADTMRLYIMFIGDFEKTATWSDEAVKGSKRFLDRCFNLQDMVTDEEGVSKKNESLIHKTIKKVTSDIDELKLNTAIAALMAMVNEFYGNGVSRGDLEQLILMLSPFVPHMAEEMWENMGFAAQYGKMAMQMPWPQYDEAKTIDAEVEMAVQVNGKLKGTVVVPLNSAEDAVVAAAMSLDKVRKAAEGMQIVKTILVKNKLVNLIVKPAR
ncbi:MAG: class I tRNA ligase family protein, partial [Oscillospiraceae bacterium]|nr:class I tRNA ligase family protein [Oscillospiraceae bacterium]